MGLTRARASPGRQNGRRDGHKGYGICANGIVGKQPKASEEGSKDIRG